MGGKRWNPVTENGAKNPGSSETTKGADVLADNSRFTPCAFVRPMRITNDLSLTLPV